MPSMFLFPLGVVYLAFGLVRHAALRLSDHDDAIPLAVVDTGETEETDESERRRTAPRMTGLKRGNGEE